MPTAGAFVLIYTIVFYAVLFGLQYYLSKMPMKWPGLILPAITFCFAMVNVISYASSGYGTIISNFFGSNIITCLLLIFYMLQRQKMNK